MLVTTLFPCKEKRNLYTISQSLNGLEKRGFQPPSSLEASQTSATHASFEVAKANKEGKERLRASSPHHLSSQNLTLLPSPKKKTKLFFIKGHSFLISFQNPTPYPSLTSRVHHPPSSTPYFLLITCSQRVPFSSAKRQLHLPKKALLS